MLSIVSCSSNLECAGFALISVTPLIIGSVLFTGASVFIMQKRNMQDTLIFKILKITLRIEEALLLLISIPLILMLF